MTGPNPDADLDDALGITQLPPAVITDLHFQAAARALDTALPELRWHQVAQAIANAEQRGAARVLAEHAAAGTPLPEEHPR